MKEFSFSIIVPSFNAANTLPETLASIVPQLSEHDEIIVVDDGSTDETPDVMEGWSTSRVRYVRQANSGGPASPRNRGIREANGSLIALFDSDDIMLPGKLEATRQAFSHYPDAGLLFTNFSTIDELGNVLSSRFLDSYTFTGPFCAKDEACVRIEPPEAYRALGSENYIGTSGVVIPRKVFDRLGGFDESLTNGDDRDLWFRVTRQEVVLFLPDCYHAYRIGSSSISKGSARKRTPSKIKVLERQLDNPLDDEFARSIRSLVSDNYCALAYESFQKSEMGRCRAEAIQALNASINSTALKLYLLSFLGSRLAARIRQLKNWRAR